MTAHPHAARHLARRISWGFLDQSLSSATNFGLGMVVAAATSSRAFGAFSLVYAVYGVALGLSEGVASTPLIVRLSAAPAELLRRSEASSVGAALVVAAMFSVPCLVAAPLLPSAVGGALGVLGLLLPGLLVQDAWRFVFMARGTPKLAAANDGLWAVLQAGGMAIVLATGSGTPAHLVLAWAGAANVAAVYGCWQGRAWPAPGSALRWLAEHRDLGPRYAVEAIAHRSGAWVTVTVVGALAGLSAVAALRGAMLLVTGPLNLLFLGVSFVAIPEGVRLFERSPMALRQAVSRLSAGVTAASALWCAAVLVAAHWIGPRLLGDTWSSARPLLPLVAAAAIAQAANIGPSQALWSLGAASRSLRTQLFVVVAMLAAASFGAAFDGAVGAAVGLLVVGVTGTFVWWMQFRLGFADAARRHTPADLAAV